MAVVARDITVMIKRRRLSVLHRQTGDIFAHMECINGYKRSCSGSCPPVARQGLANSGGTGDAKDRVYS